MWGSRPPQQLPLRSERRPIVLVGGGIGITPLYAMARTLLAARRPFDVYYLVRTRSAAAFDQHLAGLAVGRRYHLHCDDVSGLPDFDAMLLSHPHDTHYYVCGPEVMLAAIQASSDRLGRGTVFFERFTAVLEDAPRPSAGFTVALSSTGTELEVPGDKSLLAVLRDAGRDVDYACAEGTCGTCILDVLEGEIDHRDSFLTEDERDAGDCMCICVSRTRGTRLVLDL